MGGTYTDLIGVAVVTMTAAARGQVPGVMRMTSFVNVATTGFFVDLIARRKQNVSEKMKRKLPVISWWMRPMPVT